MSLLAESSYEGLNGNAKRIADLEQVQEVEGSLSRFHVAHPRLRTIKETRQIGLVESCPVPVVPYHLGKEALVRLAMLLPALVGR